MTKNGCCASGISLPHRRQLFGSQLSDARAFTGDEMPVPNSADHGQKVPKTHLKWEVFLEMR